MTIKNMGIGGLGNTFWKLMLTRKTMGTSGDLEVGIKADETGLEIGDGVITWEELEQARKELRGDQDVKNSQLHILFDGPPGETAGRFVEVNDHTGKSVDAGTWVELPDGYWELVIGG